MPMALYIHMVKKRINGGGPMLGMSTYQEPFSLAGRKTYGSHAKNPWNAETPDLEHRILCLEQSPKTPSISNLICILQKCRKERDPTYAKRLKMYMERKNLQGHIVLGNYLVSMLADCGCLFEAEEIMERLEFRNTYSWNALILSYIECGKADHVFQLYKRMQSDGLHPTTYTFVALLKACGIQKNLEMGRKLWDEVISMGLENDVFVGNALIDMFSKCGSIVESQEVFDALGSRDVVSWSSMIATYVGHGYYKNAIGCFSQMISEGGLPNAVTYAISLQACNSIRAIETGRYIFADILKRGLDDDIYVGNTILDMFCKCGYLEEAQIVFDMLPAHDIVSWNVLMAGYIELGYGKEALHCFEKIHSENMLLDDVAVICGLKACGTIRSISLGHSIYVGIVKSGLDQNSTVGNMLVDMFGKCGLLEEAQQAFDKLLSRDNVSWSALMMGYAQHGQADKALDCIDQMQMQCVSPDDVLLACSLKTCRTLNSVGKGREMHGQITKYGLEKDYVIGSVLVDMYGECGALLEARNVFDDLPVRNITTWSSIIKGCGINHQGNMAVQYFKSMQEKGLKPDSIAYTSVLVACSHTNLVFKGQEYFLIMEMGPWQTVYQFSCMVDLLARSGYVNQAVGILDTVQWPPPKETWKALLTACKIYGEVDLGQRCFKHLVTMDPNDASAYAMMADIYRNAEELDNSYRMEKLRELHRNQKNHVSKVLQQ